VKTTRYTFSLDALSPGEWTIHSPKGTWPRWQFAVADKTGGAISWVVLEADARAICQTKNALAALWQMLWVYGHLCFANVTVREKEFTFSHRSDRPEDEAAYTEFNKVRKILIDAGVVTATTEGEP
jgi:hypothetical protein